MAPDTLAPDTRTELAAYEDSLKILAYGIQRDTVKEQRQLYVRSFIKTLARALKVEDSFYHPFDSLQSISFQYPADSSFRVITFQLYVDVNEYRYYGAIQKNSSELQLYPLVDRSHEIDYAEKRTLTPDRWYGALYYNIKQFETPDGPKYLLFGFDGHSFWQRQKLVDVLYFDEEGQPKFGAPVFVDIDPRMGERTRKRILLNYSANASITLNFNTDEDMIIYDNLAPMKGEYGQGETFIPDGTYRGYQLKDGLWVGVEKVFNTILEEAPREQPIFDKREKRGLFGGPE